MIPDSYFHFKLNINRNGKDYGLNKKEMQSSLYLLTGLEEVLQVTIGGSNSDYVHIKNLVKGHICCTFSNRKLLIHANGDLQIVTKEGKKNLTSKQSAIFNITELPFNYKLLLPNQTTIVGKIHGEEEKLSPAEQNYLEEKYGPIHKIQEGKSCLLFKTKDDQLIKVLLPSFARNKGVVTRFKNAAEKLFTSADPAFLEISEVNYDPELNLAYIVRKFFPGDSIENYVARKGILQLSKAKFIVRSIAERLQIFQKFGYCSRNLTPNNILICDDNTIRITGFFLLKSEANLTCFNARMVIPRYSAPEQIGDPSSVDILSDIFSLGAIFHTLLLGDPPFKALNAAQYVDRLLSSRSITFDEIHEIAPGIPEDVARVMASMLAFDKNKRLEPQQVISILAPTEVEEFNLIAPPDPKLDDNNEQGEDTKLNNVPRLTPEETSWVHYILCPPFQPCKLNKDQEFKIGRDSFNQLILPSHEVSRLHAVIRWEDDGYIVEDQQSINGTYVNNHLIKTHQLCNGDKIDIGNHTITYQRVASGRTSNKEISGNNKKFLRKTMQMDKHNDEAQRLKNLHEFRSCLRGDIERMPLAPVLQLLAGGNKTGCLKLADETQTGYIYFLDGLVVHCINENLSGREAFFNIMLWEKGTFEFAHSEAAKEVTMSDIVDGLLIEMARLEDEGIFPG